MRELQNDRDREKKVERQRQIDVVYVIEDRCIETHSEKERERLKENDREVEREERQIGNREKVESRERREAPVPRRPRHLLHVRARWPHAK